MSGLAGTSNANLRIVGKPDPDSQNPVQVIVDNSGPSGEDEPEIDKGGNILRLKHADGSLTISLSGKPLGNVNAGPEKTLEWYDNLVERIDEGELQRIADDLLRGVEQDKTSRMDWIEERAEGIKLLGLKLQTPAAQGTTDGAPVEGMSKVRHPLLLEAVLRFQANARSELLPTDGPVKIRNDDNNAQLKEDQVANAYERDMNHYLTAVATEYYPDTDRMLLMLGFGGTTFKKVYYCPLRNRPVSESVDADDIIVNQAATDLANARRVTHRTYLRPSIVKRLQILGVYRDVTLHEPIPTQPDAVQEELREQQGLTVNSFRTDDRDREIYEICCELDIKGFEHEHKDKPSGLEIPYKVTIDVSSRKILAVTRNYNEDDKKMPTARTTYIKYTFVPGFGFYDIGLLNILGNTTNAVTAAWREMLDNGMYACFPGFLIVKGGTRQNTNIMRVPPGGGLPIETNGMTIDQAVAPLPYNSAGQAALYSLVENMVETGQRVGGTAELQVGEGKMEAPVGTTLALIDQAVKVMNSVHKRLHASQAAEFKLLIECFREHPESFIERKCISKHPWDLETFIQALNNCELVPQADPNTASMGQRVMKIQGLKQLQQAAPQLYDPVAVDTAAMQALGWANPEQFFVPKSARAAPPPQLQELMQKMKNEQIEAAAKLQDANTRTSEAKTKADELQAKMDAGHFKPTEPQPGEPPDTETTLDIAEAHAKLLDAHTRARDVAIKERQESTEDENRDKDREAKEKETAIDLAKAVIGAPTQGNAGKQVGVKEVGSKTNKIIKDVDKGLDRS